MTCINKFDKLVACDITPRGAIKTIISPRNDFSYIKTNLKQYQDAIIDVIMYDLGDVVSDKVKRSVGIIEFVDIDTRAQIKDNVVGLREFTTGEIYHEIGHHIERTDRDVHKACVRFLDERTDDSPLLRLSDYYHNENYDNEVAQWGGFIDIYAGKRVKYDVMTEILSVGLEYFNTNENITKLYNYDREHFEFILNIICGE